jgi:DNA-binding XRE family transcriptional regulator
MSYSLALIPSLLYSPTLTGAIAYAIILEIANSCQAILRRWNVMSVRQARDQRGWSQQALATRAGVSMHTIYNVERGKPVLPMVRSAICRALGTEDVDIVVSTQVNKSDAEK